MAKRRETELYPPLKAWLEERGFTVHAEVNGCDIAARRDDDLILVEMKTSLNLDLLLQVVLRQETHASVYAAVPAPALRNKRWRELARLVKRLEAGLLLVHLDSALQRVEVAAHPMPFVRQRRKQATTALLTEMAGRTLSLNTGGVNRKKIVTAYREQAIHVAVALERTGPAAPKTLRLAGAPAKAGVILRDNHYGWFERLRPGLYALTLPGRAALAEYSELAERLRGRLHPVQTQDAAG